MTKQEVLNSIEEVFKKAGDAPIKGMVFALTVDESVKTTGLCIAVDMKISELDEIISQLEKVRTDGSAAPEGKNPIEELLEALSGKDDCGCEKCVARRAAGEPKVSVISLSDLFKRAQQSKQEPTSGSGGESVKAKFSRLAEEARSKGKSMDEFMESLLEGK